MMLDADGYPMLGTRATPAADRRTGWDRCDSCGHPVNPQTGECAGCSD